MSEKSKYCEKAVSTYTLSYLNMYERLTNQPKVNPGDIIYLKNSNNGAIKNTHGVKQTFKVEEMHPSGLVIARRILPNGKFGPSEIVNDGPWDVEVDQTFIENVIMKNEDAYDPSTAITELEKEKRRVSRYNKSISKKANVQNPQEIEEFMKTLKVGDTLWVRDNLLLLKHGKWKVLKEATLEKSNYSGYKRQTFLVMEIERSYRYGSNTQTYTSKVTSDSFHGCFYTKEEPMSVEQEAV
jgi:hypothetical protein